jgi:ribosomal protein S18 acetylase RimI-like enzyme
VNDRFAVAPLAADHDRSQFSSEVEALDRYLRTQATQDIRRHLANCFVASPADSMSVVAYYTLSSASVALTELPPEQAKRLPRYPLVPAALIGRLAVDRHYRGRGLGAALLFDAVARAARSEAAVHAIIVDAKDDTAARFYRHHGFLALASRHGSLFLPAATAAKLLDG